MIGDHRRAMIDELRGRLKVKFDVLVRTKVQSAVGSHTADPSDKRPVVVH